jgi:hypothetical protein
MTEHSLIHVKLDYGESVQSKKDLLSSEAGFLRILKTTKRYHLLRKEELILRLRMQNRMKELKINLGKLNDILPKIRIPDILKKKEPEEEKPKKQKEEKEIKNKNPERNKDLELETQLKDIQERLRRLG